MNLLVIEFGCSMEGRPKLASISSKISLLWQAAVCRPLEAHMCGSAAVTWRLEFLLAE